MNVFQSGSTQFRRGKVLDDTAAECTMHTGVSTRLDDEDVVQIAFKPSTSYSCQHQLTDFPSLFATAPAHQRQSAGAGPVTSSSPQRRLFPSTPYYGLLSRCEVNIEVSLDDSKDASVSKSAPLPGYNPPSTQQCLSRMQHLLNECAQRHGTVYHLGTEPSPYEFSSLSSSKSSASPNMLSYGAFVEGMQDGLRQLTSARVSCASTAAAPHTKASTATTQHCFIMRLLGHRMWKDLGVLLCVENARLLICLLSSSRVTQKNLTLACAETGVELEWLSGAALVVEPPELAGADLNPVWVVWDAVLHLPLLSSNSISTERTVDGDAAASSTEDINTTSVHTFVNPSVGAHDALNMLVLAPLPLHGCSLSLVSSLPFRGSRQCRPTGRFTEATLLFSEDTVPTTTTAIPAAVAVVGPRRPVARRYVWRLLPSYAWLLPHFLTRLIECLIDQCGLHAFTLRCGCPPAGGTPPIASTVSAVHIGETKKASGMAGVRLVHGDTPSFLAQRRGPSTVSWIAFSRLSGAAWVDAEAREGLAWSRRLGGDGEGEEDEEEVELEFELNAVQYERCASTTATTAASQPSPPLMWKRPRDVPAPEEAVETEYVRPDGCVHTETWGPSFKFDVSVKRLIVMDEMGD
ncbi:hypothetical protein ABL78_7871 [Leptomonas seymouri]|uniref:Uncharacterized protein n=1 Tax=Leptomonas seymouri TaxID=5684 RepID=A0A0N1HTE1_LEPSE|nr:hypothetical protein ABL78_7871 [Leptomonas seymouri]|eukprot:KPI83103.1 hypothetical protein ABL78_7871 [Leptomonas seymouri]